MFLNALNCVFAWETIESMRILTIAYNLDGCRRAAELLTTAQLRVFIIF